MTYFWTSLCMIVTLNPWDTNLSIKSVYCLGLTLMSVGLIKLGWVQKSNKELSWRSASHFSWLLFPAWTLMTLCLKWNKTWLLKLRVCYIICNLQSKLHIIYLYVIYVIYANKIKFLTIIILNYFALFRHVEKLSGLTHFGLYQLLAEQLPLIIIVCVKLKRIDEIILSSSC